MEHDKRVLKGASLLDVHFKGYDWRSEIDIETLEMDSSSQCVLGQLFGDYQNGLIALKLDDVSMGLDARREAGFSTCAWDSYDWAMLEYEWKTYLRSVKS